MTQIYSTIHGADKRTSVKKQSVRAILNATKPQAATPKKIIDGQKKQTLTVHHTKMSNNQLIGSNKSSGRTEDQLQKGAKAEVAARKGKEMLEKAVEQASLESQRDLASQINQDSPKSPDSFSQNTRVKHALNLIEISPEENQESSLPQETSSDSPNLSKILETRSNSVP